MAISCLADAGFYHKSVGQKASFLQGRQRQSSQNGIKVLIESMTKRAYFDWNATAPLKKSGRKPREAMNAALGLPGNASVGP